MNFLRVRNCDSEKELRAALLPALAALRENAAVVYPTETIYGIGASALNSDAIRAVFAAKNRAEEKAPPVLISSRAHLEMLVKEIPSRAQTLMNTHWPGALTLVLPAREELPSQLLGRNERGEKTIAVRQTAQRVARILCEDIGPLVATSANLAGAFGKAAAPRRVEDIDAELLARVRAAIDDGETVGAPSSIVDCTLVTPKLLREGALSRQILNLED